MDAPPIQVFRPTFEEFKDFGRYIEYIESKGAHHAGICKIVAPKEYIPRKSGYDNLDDFLIKEPVVQKFVGKNGIFVNHMSVKKKTTLKELKKISSTVPHSTPNHDNLEHLEKKYWSNIGIVSPIYGADVSGSITDSDWNVWNIGQLPTLLDDILRNDVGMRIDGVNTPYLYFGTWMATFAWHTEDCELYSINYIHHGWPKQWYSIPPAYARCFEVFARDVYRSDFNRCPAFLRHKTFMISPNVLRSAGIPVNSVVQEEGEMIITFPYGYHAGFNMGFNIAESTNFASERWIEFGKKAVLCHCRPDTVRINMEPFVNRYQPHLLTDWLADIDPVPHPLDSMYGKNPNGCTRTAKLGGLYVKLEDSEDGKSPPCSTNISPEKRKISSVHNNNNNNNNNQNKKKTVTSIAGSVSSSGRRRKAAICSSTYDLSITPSKMKRSQSSTTISSSIADLKDSIPKFLSDEPYLWITNGSFDLENEKRINLIDSQMEPFCSICCVMRTSEQKEMAIKEILSSKMVKSKSNSPITTTSTTLPLRSNVLIPEMAYLKGKLLTNNEEGSNNNNKNSTELQLPNHLDSPLLQCTVCKITVHARCYGLCDLDAEMNSSEKEMELRNFIASWKCDRCRRKKFNSVCCLCNMRCGALRRVVEPVISDLLLNQSSSSTTITEATAAADIVYRQNSNIWVHIICALGTQAIQFRCVARRLVQLPKPLKSTSKQRCSVCGDATPKYPLAVCVSPRCAVHMHVTCALYGGLYMQTDSHPWEFFVYCKMHSALYNKTVPKKPVLHVGSEVWAKHRYNNRFYSAKLISYSKEPLCRLRFEHDGTYCDSNPLDTIIWPLTSTAGIPGGKLHCLPDEGTPVEVKWDDGEIYEAVYMGCTPEEWTVEFETGETFVLPRTQLYAKSEEIPDRIKKRISSY